jgi:WhiB family transcriptional regulator, redox-sensing transcriptional regulator
VTTGAPGGGRRCAVTETIAMSAPGIFGSIEDEGEEPGWQERALCAQTDPEAFFPEKGGSTREAKRVCGSCEVRSECLGYALEHDERFGIWGGLSERERRRLKRQAS